MFDPKRSDMSDEALLSACRQGNLEIFSQLWERHHKAGLVAARNLAPGLDAEELVSEAYLKILDLVSKGRGPQGAFRPYLYQTIKTVATDQLRSPERTVENLDEVQDLDKPTPTMAREFDLSAVVAAFSTLSRRWQEVLWYSEVEQLPPRKIAPLLAISPNSVSALLSRAREALKSAWAEQHIGQTYAGPVCKETLQQLQRYKRDKLTARVARDIKQHLATCQQCQKAEAELSKMNRQLGLTLSLVLLGSSGTAAMFSNLGLSVSAAAKGAAGSAAHAAKDTSVTTGLSSGGVTSGTTVAVTSVGSTTLIAAASLAVAAVIGGTLMISSINSDDADTPTPDWDSFTQPSSISSDVSRHDYPLDEDVPPFTTDDDSATSSDPENGQTESDPAPPPDSTPPPNPAPPPNPFTPPDAPEPPADDPFLAPALTCYLPGAGFLGTASEYGVLLARVSQHGGSPVEIIDPLYDPNNPNSLFENGVIVDGYGNSFDFGLFTGTDPAPVTDWFSSIALEPLTQWGFVEEGLGSLNMELRFVTPDRRYSPWTAIDLTDNDCDA